MFVPFSFNILCLLLIDYAYDEDSRHYDCYNDKIRDSAPLNDKRDPVLYLTIAFIPRASQFYFTI